MTSSALYEDQNILEEKDYKIRSGVVNEGKDYEVSLLAYYGILLLNPRLQDAWIATNADDCGDFDDVIIYKVDKATGLKEMFMIQCKHSNIAKTIGLQQFLNGRKEKDYFLEKYINSFNMKINPALSSNTNSIICSSAFNVDLKCILFTNNDTNASDILEDIEDTTLTFLNTGNGKTYKFKTEKLNQILINTTLTKNLRFAISELTLSDIFKDLNGKTSKIKLKEVMDQEKIDKLVLEAKDFKTVTNQTNNELKSLISQSFFEIVSNAELLSVTSKDKLKMKLNGSISKQKIKQTLTKTKLSAVVSESILREKISQDFEINYEFLNRTLFLFSKQAHNQHVPNLIKNAMLKIPKLRLIIDLNLDQVVEKYTSFINDWAQGKLGGHYILTKERIVKKLSEILLECYTSDFYKQAYVELPCTNVVDKWHEIIQNKSVILINTNRENNLMVMKLLYTYLDGKLNRHDMKRFFKINSKELFGQTFEDQRIKNEMLKGIKNGEEITLMYLYKVLWKLEKTPLVLEIHSHQDYANITNILKLSGYKLKVVVLNSIKDNLTISNNASHFLQNLSDLEEGPKRTILEETVKIQGRPMQLKKLAKKFECLTKLITVADIISIMMEEFNIGNTFNPLPEYFIQRIITPTFVDGHLLTKTAEHCEDVYVIYGKCKSELCKWFKASQLSINEADVIDCDDILKRPKLYSKKYKIIADCDKLITDKFLATHLQNKNVHFLIHNYYYRNLQWIRTIGSTKTIKLFKLPPNFKDPFSDKTKSLSFENQINVINANPGLGKTVMMHYIAQNTSPGIWVLQISLSKHTSYYRSEQFKKANEEPSKHLHYFNNHTLDSQKRNNRLEKETFVQFLNSNSLLILLDGFDEISPNYKEEVSAMIRAFCEKGYRQLITTRTSLGKYLENEFDVISVTLNPFTITEQVYFLTEYFKTHLNNSNCNQAVLEDFVTKLLSLAKKNLNDWEQEFTGVPLQIRLLAEVFKDDCCSYIRDPAYQLRENFDLLFLYETFLSRKIDILDEKFEGRVDHKSFEKYQKLYALKVLFDESHLQELELDRQLMELSTVIDNSAEHLQRNGVIVAKDEVNVTFIHRTFAEYSAAKWLAENLDNSVAKSLANIIFQADYFVTRNIYDRLLAKNLPLHEAIISQQTTAARDLIRENPDLLDIADLGGRLPFHLAAGWGIRHPLPKQGDPIDPDFHKTKTSCNQMEKLLEEMCCQKEFPMDAIDFAIASDSVANLNVILAECRSEIPRIQIGKRNIKNYIYYASRYGYTAIIHRILSTVNEHVSKYINTALDKRFNRTAVHWAANIGHEDVMKLFFTHQNSNSVELLSKTDIRGQTALHLASKKNHLAIVNFLLQNMARTDLKDNNCRTATHLAAQNGFTDILKLLLADHLDDVNLTEKCGNTALHLAALQGHEDTVSILLSLKASTEVRNKEGKTCLHMAAISGHMGTIDLLSNHETIDTIDCNGNSALHLAAINGHTSAAELLISKKADPCKANHQKRIPLHFAVSSRRKSLMNLLLSHSDVDAEDSDGNTPLHLAASQNLVEIVKELLKEGAMLNTVNHQGRTALHLAALNECGKTALELINDENSKVAMKDCAGRTPLHLAAMNNCPAVLNLLLSKEVNIDLKDNDGRTPLHLAVMEGHTGIATLLLVHKADITIRNSDGSHILHIAAAKGYEDLVATILSKVKNADGTDNRGRTALHLAAQEGHIGIVNLLIEKQAKVTILDDDGNTAADLAEMKNYSDVASVLHSREDAAFI